MEQRLFEHCGVIEAHHAFLNDLQGLIERIGKVPDFGINMSEIIDENQPPHVMQ